VTDARDLHTQKHFLQITSTDAGMRIAVNPLRQNASFSSRDNLQSTANVTDPRELHSEKQYAQITSTDVGM
jgi:hypothetical protein